MHDPDATRKVNALSMAHVVAYTFDDAETTARVPAMQLPTAMQIVAASSRRVKAPERARRGWLVLALVVVAIAVVAIGLGVIALGARLL